MANQGKIKIAKHINTPCKGYVNLRFDPDSKALFAKFEDNTELQLTRTRTNSVTGNDTMLIQVINQK